MQYLATIPIVPVLVAILAFTIGCVVTLVGVYLFELRRRSARTLKREPAASRDNNREDG